MLKEGGFKNQNYECSENKKSRLLIRDDRF